MTESTKPNKNSLGQNRTYKKSESRNDSNNSYVYKRKYPDLD